MNTSNNSISYGHPLAKAEAGQDMICNEKFQSKPVFIEVPVYN